MPTLEDLGNTLWNQLVTMVPGIIAAIIWIILGIIVGIVVGSIVTRVLRKYVERPLSVTPLGKTLTTMGLEFSELIGGLTKAFIISISLVAAMSYVPLSGAAGELIYGVVSYLPYLIGGIAVITLGLVLAISLAKYIGSLLSTGFGEVYKSLVNLVENLLLAGLIAIVLTVAFTLLKLPASLIYPLLVGVTAIAVGVIIVIEVFKTITETYPDFSKLAPFLQFIVVFVFIFVGLSAIFSQYVVVGDTLRMLSASIMIAFAVILIPVAFYLVKKVLIEAERKPSKSE
ncbi:MAG: mechanosensitive ion channel family protein [Thermoprotei archaeon]